MFGLIVGWGIPANPGTLTLLLFLANVASGWGFLYLVLIAACFVRMAFADGVRARALGGLLALVATLIDAALLSAWYR